MADNNTTATGSIVNPSGATEISASDDIQDLILSTQTIPPSEGVFGSSGTHQTQIQVEAPHTQPHMNVNVVVDQNLIDVQSTLGGIETAEDSVSCLFIRFTAKRHRNPRTD